MARTGRTPETAPARVNPVRTRADWEAMRASALADPGAFHGDIAARTIHWFALEVGEAGAWLSRDDDGCWRGWEASTAQPVSLPAETDFVPWT